MEEAKQHLRLLSCVLDAKDFTKLLNLAAFDEKIESGKSAACLAIRNDPGRVLLLQVFKDRWFTAETDALNRHPVSVARTVQSWFQQLATHSWNVSACYPLASIEANLSLRALKGQNGVGSQMRKFLTDQLKDRDDDNHAASRVRLSIFERAQYADLYKWCRGPCWQDATVGGFEGLRKLMFEIVWTLSVAQVVSPGFKHNDLHAANVLVTLDKTACPTKPVAPAAAAAPAAATPAPVPAISLATDDVVMADASSGAAAAGALGSSSSASGTGDAAPAPALLPQQHLYYHYTINVPIESGSSSSSGGVGAAAVIGSSTTTKHPVPGTVEVASPLATVRTRPDFSSSLTRGGKATPAGGAGAGAASASTPVSFLVPAYPCKALLADFDFCWLPGHINQKVLEFQADDPVWGVSSTHDDCYDLFMLCYHLYITYFEQLLERNQGICSEVFMRAWRKSSTAADAGDEEGAKMWRLNGLNDVRTYHVTRDQMERLWEPQRDLQQFLEFVVPHRFFSKTDRQLEADGIHRWRYNEVAITSGLHRELHTPLEALQHPYFTTFRNLAGEGSSLLKTGTALKVVGHPLNAPAQPASDKHHHHHAAAGAAAHLGGAPGVSGKQAPLPFAAFAPLPTGATTSGSTRRL